MSTVRSDDDVLPNLPPLDGDAEDAPSDNEEADSSEGEAEESVGLDTAVADGLIDEAELFGLNEHEGESWTRDDEPAIDTGLDEDGLEAEGEEGGWASFADTSDDLDDEDFGGDEAAPSFVDRGEEGIAEEHSVKGNDDESELPPLEVNADAGNEAADDLDLREAQELETATLSFEDERRWMGASLPDVWPKERVKVSFIGNEDELMPSIAGQEITSYAIDSRDPNRIVVGTRLSGAFVSVNAGASFEPRNGWSRQEELRVPVAFHVALEQREGSTRLWGRTARGALYRSDDFARTWLGPVLLQPVMALAVDPEGGVVIVSVPRKGPAQLGRFAESGWVMRNVPRPATLTEDLFVDVAAHASHIAIAYDGDPAGTYYSNNNGESFVPIPSLPSPTCVAFAREDAGVSLYAALFFAGADRGVVIRRDANGTESVVFDVEEANAKFNAASADEGEGSHRIHALRVSSTPEETSLHVTTGVGIFRVVLR